MKTAYVLPDELGRLQPFLSPEYCRGWLLSRLHPSGPTCPECGELTAGKQAQRFNSLETVRCGHCGKSFTAFTGTVFHRSRLEPAQIVLMLMLLRLGRGEAEIAGELGTHERTIRRWRKRFMELGTDMEPFPAEGDQTKDTPGKDEARAT